MSKHQRQENLLELCNQIKAKIQLSIDQGNLPAARSNLRDYKSIMPDDIDSLAMEASIGIKEKMLKRLRGHVNASAPEVKRTKIAVFVKKGLDRFIDGIIETLSTRNTVRKILVNDLHQIETVMEWSDVAWFEWCDELVIYGSRLEMAKQKKIICRLHSYEAFTDHLEKVEWNHIDRLIFVADHIRDIVVSKVPVVKEKTRVIPLGIDTACLSFRERKKGFNIAYLGYLNSKKGPMLLLHAFRSILDLDNRYKLYIAGTFQEERVFLYFRHMTRELGLQDNLIFDGWQSDVNAWLEDKDYILCTSEMESQNISVMQAMAKGIKPLIHNFVGAKNIYPSEYLWNSIRDCVRMVNSEAYHSSAYRDFIVDHYSTQKQSQTIQHQIFELTEESTKPEFDSASYWNQRLNRKFDIEGVGYQGLGKIYNHYLYQIRLEILNHFAKRLLSGWEDKTVLELGPGVGIYTEHFFKNGVEKYRGIDIAEISIRRLAENYADYEFFQGDISNPDYYPKDRYDLILAADVLLHILEEQKYRCTIGNIAKALKQNGFVIVFDPITLTHAKSPSPHVIIRELSEVAGIMEEYGLEIAKVFPAAFFMNYPFDSELAGRLKNAAFEIFQLLQEIYSDAKLSDIAKTTLAEWIVSLEKQLLVCNQFGFSQKVLIIKKKANTRPMPELSLSHLWPLQNQWVRTRQAQEAVYADRELNNHPPFKQLANRIDRISLGDSNPTDPIDPSIETIKTAGDRFIPYDHLYIDRFDFGSSSVLFGKRERISETAELIEAVLSNREMKCLVVTNVWHNRKNSTVYVPEPFRHSRHFAAIGKIIEDIIRLPLTYRGKVAGFICDPGLKAHVEENLDRYLWESGLPASQFMPAAGFLMIYERYQFAKSLIRQDHVILEAASGCGYGAAYLSDACSSVYALDLSQENIWFGGRAYQFPNIYWATGDVSSLPFDDACFDRYISFETLEHIPSQRVSAFFEESRRILKPGGKLILSTPNLDMRRRIKNPFHIREYTFEEFYGLLQRFYAEIEIHSVVHYRVERGFKPEAFDMVAVCTK